MSRANRRWVRDRLVDAILAGPPPDLEFREVGVVRTAENLLDLSKPRGTVEWDMITGHPEARVVFQAERFGTRHHHATRVDLRLRDRDLLEDFVDEVYEAFRHLLRG